MRETKNGQAIKIDGKVFLSTTKAAENLGISQSALWLHIKDMKDKRLIRQTRVVRLPHELEIEILENE